METDLKALEGKKVVVTTGGEELEGTVETGSPLGIVLKPKNSSRSLLIEAKDIDTIVEANSGPKKLKPRSLPSVSKGKFREHLLERHGYPLADIQAMTEDAAETFHGTIEHGPLGHFHREVTPVEDAIAEAEAAV